MESAFILPKVRIGTKSDMVYIQEKIRSALHLRLEALIASKNIESRDRKYAIALSDKWLERVLREAGPNITINGQEYAEVMEQKEDFEPLDLKIQSALKETTRKRDWLSEHIRTNLRLNKVDEIKNRYLKVQLSNLKSTCEYPEPEQLESLPERAVESLNSELKSIPERVFEELQESVRLFNEISKTQSITHSKMIQTTNCVKARECHFKVSNERTAYDPLTEEEKNLLIQPDLPGEKVKRKSCFPLADLVPYPPLTLNKRYQNRLLNRRRVQESKLHHK